MNNFDFLNDRRFILFAAKFLGVFCALYFGTLFLIGLTSPENYYSSFAARYLDYVTFIKMALVHGTQIILHVFNIKTVILPGFVIRYPQGVGVYIAMDCVGYGVYSFWIAFVVASDQAFKNKILWIVGGVLGLFFINVIRITLYLVSLNNGWPFPFGIDHHTWFNIFAYLLIFLMIYLFTRSAGKPFAANA